MLALALSIVLTFALVESGIPGAASLQEAPGALARTEGTSDVSTAEGTAVTYAGITRDWPALSGAPRVQATWLYRITRWASSASP